MRVSASTSCGYAGATPRSAATAIPSRLATRRGVASPAPWGHAPAAAVATDAPYRASARREAAGATPWDRPLPARSPALLTPWTLSARREAAGATPWDRPRPIRHPDLAAPWVAAARREAGTASPWDRARPHRSLALAAPHRHPGYRVPATATPWGRGGAWRAISWRAAYIADVTILPQPSSGGVYRVANSLGLYRSADGAELPATSIRLSTDIDASLWQWSATLRGGADLLYSDGSAPVELEAVVNGWRWRLLAEDVSETRTVSGAQVSVSGRSLAAYLLDPYSPAATRVVDDLLLAQQLAALELEYTGWGLDWRTVDWLVPAGTWSYQGQTPLQAIAAITASVDARVHSAPAELSLTVRPRYPVDPRDWVAAAPDATIPGAVCRQIATRTATLPAYDRVVVAGRTGDGVLVVATRRGCAGATPAPQVTDALITDLAAGTERARQRLAATGPGATATVEVPLFAAPLAPGLLLPGQLAEVLDPAGPWRGLVTGVQVEARTDQQSRLTVWQTATLERRLPW